MNSVLFFREKQKISRSVRTLEKRLRDAAGLADESRKQADAYKEQVRTIGHLLFERLMFVICRRKRPVCVSVI